MANITKEYLDRKFKEQQRYIDKRFDGVDKRFDGVDKRFEGVEKRFESVDRQFKTVDDHFKTIDARFDQQTKDLKAHAVELQEELARMTNKGFEEIIKQLDVRQRVEELERDMKLIRKAIN